MMITKIHPALWAAFLLLATASCTPPPGSSTPGAVVAYALVRADGTLVPDSTKNVLSVVRVWGGHACLRLSVQARVAIASADALINKHVIAETYVPHDGALRIGLCPADHVYAVRTMLPSGDGIDAAFYVVFF